VAMSVYGLGMPEKPMWGVARATKAQSLMRGFFALAVAAASLNCFSQADSTAIDCAESQRSANECAWKEYAIADQKLNRTYRRVLSALPAASKTSLRAEQREWLKNLQPACDEEAGPVETGGQIRTMDFYYCMAAQTAARTKAIEAWGKKK
jgi:uncharacterized protein YecT (DUF1311 family)